MFVKNLARFVAVNEDFTLPSQVPVYHSGGNVTFRNVNWDDNNVNTEEEGTYVFEGVVSGYSEKVILSLQVGEESSEKESVFPDEVDRFGVPKLDTLTANLQDIDDYQYLKLKVPRRMEEQSHIKLLKTRLAEYKIEARDFNHIQSAIVNIEEFIWYLRDKIIHRIEMAEDEVEDIEERLEVIEDELIEIESDISDMVDDVYTDAVNDCSNGESLINSVGGGTLDLKGIKGSGNIEVRSEDGCVILGIGKQERSITIIHRGEGEGTTNATGQESRTGQGISYSFTAWDEENITIEANATDSDYMVSRWLVNGISETGDSIELENISQSYIIEVFFEIKPREAGEPLAYSGGKESVYLTYDLGTESGLVVLEFHMGGMYPDRMELIYPWVPPSQLSGDYSSNIQAISGHPPFLWRDTPENGYKWRMHSLDGKGKGVTRDWNDEDGNPANNPQDGFVHREGKMFFYYKPQNGETRLGIRVKPTDFDTSSWFLYIHKPGAKDLGYAYRMRANDSRDWHQSVIDYSKGKPPYETGVDRSMRTPIIKES